MEYGIKELQKKQLHLLKVVTKICDDNHVTYYAAFGTVLGAIRHHGFIPWDGDIDIYVPENELAGFVEAMKKNLPEECRLDFRDEKKKLRDFPRIGYKGYDTNLLHIDVFRLAGAPENTEAQKKLRRITGCIHHIMNVKQKGFTNYVMSGRKVFGALLVSAVTFFVPLSAFVKLIDHYSRKYPFETSAFIGNSVSGTVKSIFPKDYLGKGLMVDFEDIQIRVPEQYDVYLKQMYGNYLELPPEEERNRALNYVFREVTNPQNGLITLIYK